MEPLLSELTSVISEFAPGADMLQARSKITGLLAVYDIKHTKFTAGHSDVSEKIKLFLSAKKLEGLSPLTITSYKLDLKKFGSYFHKPIDQITTQDIRLFLGQFENLKSSSIGKKISVLKSFFSWLTEEEIILRDPTRKIKPPRQEKRMPKALDIKELEMIRESCKTLRERALVELFYATGCRLSEIYKLNHNDIDWNGCSFTVLGKGNKEREVFFSDKAYVHLKKYIDSRSDSHRALFITERRPIRRLGRRSIQSEIKKTALRAGVKKNVHPHVYRHTMATLTLNRGADLAVVQSLLGHSNPSTTQIYAQLSSGRRRQQYEYHMVQ